jgi:TonB dependent receptor
VLGLLGMVSDIVGNYNYDKSGNALAPGVPVKRNYGLNWYEFYGQDAFRVKSNLTITYGVRWSLFPPPWEVNGYEAIPTCVAAANPGIGCPAGGGNLGSEFNQNVLNMLNGIGYSGTPLVSFRLGGAANNGPGFYNFEKSDFSPRISFAYSPRAQGGWLRNLVGDNDKTVIRGGFSRVYDRAGMGVAQHVRRERTWWSRRNRAESLLQSDIFSRSWPGRDCRKCLRQCSRSSAHHQHQYHSHSQPVRRRVF